MITRAALAFLVALPVTTPAPAGERTVVLSVPGMTCVSCPIIVRHAIAAVKGVTAVETVFDTRTAAVTFDDAVTSLAAIRRAAADLGYATEVQDAGS